MMNRALRGGKIFGNKESKYARPYLIEILYSKDILISNLTLVTFPSWNIHPVYSSNILIKGITIVAPVRSPNTMVSAQIQELILVLRTVALSLGTPALLLRAVGINMDINLGCQQSSWLSGG